MLIVPTSRGGEIYPGEYCAMAQLEYVLESAQLPGKKESTKPLVNMEEHEDFFTLEIGMPGLKREDLYVFIEGNILAIIALQKQSHRNPLMKMHEFDMDFIERYIPIPENADMAFVSGELRDGMLCLHIPKGTAAPQNNCNPIVVY